MKKEKGVAFGKKLLSLFLAMAMVITMFQLPGTATAYAAGTAVKLYFELPDGTDASDWCVNVWSKATVTEGDTDHAFRPSTWGNGSGLPTLLADEKQAGWGYVVISGSIEGLQFVDKNGTEFNCWNAEIAKKGYKEAYFSTSNKKWYTTADKATEIKAAEVRNIFILAGASGLAGSDWNQNDTNNALKQDAKDSNKFSITYKNVAAGTYEYKILQDPENCGWDKPWGYGTGSGGNRSVTVEAPADVTFTIDLTDTTDAKNVDVKQSFVKTIVAENGNITAGKETALQTAAKYYDGKNAQAKDVTVSYKLKGEPKGVTLENNKITVSESAGLTEVTVIAVYDGFEQEMTIPVVKKQYKVTINMYSPDLKMEPGVSDIYIFENDENGGSRNTVVNMDKTVTDEENGVTWVQGTTTLPFSSLGIIARDQAGTWGGGQDGNQYYVIDENTSEITLWYVYGKTPVTEKPTITKEDPRYLYLEYENPDKLETTPQFYSWTTGFAAKCVDFEADGEGKWKIQVPVKSSCTKVDFVVVLDASGSDWIKDGGDHSIVFPEGQNVVCAIIKKGEEPKLSAPYNKGYETKPKDGQIQFYYRDDNALIAGTLADQKVAVEIDGQEYPMVYNAQNLRFEYTYNTLEDGRTYYRYKVGDDYVLDKFNTNQEEKDGTTYSYVEYYKLNASVKAEVMNASFNYNENNVVKFTVDQAETDEQKLEVAAASIDVSSLGGSSALSMVPDLQAVTISVTEDTALGTKTLPIVVTDQYGNEYTTSVDVDVVARTKSSDKDFDWDESVIYFMVTDRFFDGNESNNAANGEQTYGKDNAGLYHGGDFAGITQKLDYLEDLGINTIWITPIVENIPGVTVTGEGSSDVPYNAAFHGYWASDFTKLNPALGNKEEFKTLIDKAHSRGIRIMVDIVVNHAGYDADFGDMIRSGEDIVSGSDQKDSLSNLPDFRTEDPAVSAQLVKWQTQWVKDYGIDYFRVDTVKHVENDTWAELKNALTEVDPNFKMIGEYAGGGYASNGNTLGTGEMDSDLDFDFNDQATSFVNGNISSVENFMTARNVTLNNTYLTGQFLGSHDEDGFKQKLLDAGVTEERATEMAMIAATLQITAKGQPVIYYGEEVGQTGLNNYPYQTNRYDFDWSLVKDDNKTYQHYKKLLAIRKAYIDVFARGTRTAVTSSDEDGYDVVARAYDGTKLYVGLNIKDADKTISVPVSEAAGSTMKDLYSGKTYTVSTDGNVKITIPKAADGGTVILKKEASSNGGSSSTGTTETVKDNTTTVTNPDGSKTETTVIKDLPADTKASVNVTTDAKGNKTTEASVETKGTEKKSGVSTSVSADVVKAITDKAETTDVTIKQEVKKADGSTAYTVEVSAGDMKAGDNLKLMKKDEKTGELVLVNKKDYTVSADGSVDLTIKNSGEYVLLSQKDANKETSRIKKTVKATKTSVTVKKKKTTKFPWSKKLNMANVDKIVYTSSKKSVVTVNKNGKITAKKKGTAKVKAVVTLKNGTKKTVTMKVKVK